MKIGYGRVSTLKQAKDGNSLESQVKALDEAGAERIFTDTYTGTKANRPELDKLLSEITTGDTLIVTKLDRIARTAMEGFQLIQNLMNQGISVHVLNMGLIDNTPTGRLILQIMLAFAEFERAMIVERTSEGKAIAMQNPNYRDGRPKKFSKAQINHALELCKIHPVSYVCKITGISKSTIMRAKREAKIEELKK